MLSAEIAVLCDVVERLTLQSIPYMLTGSMAMNFYAEPRMTRDIDIVLELGITNAHSLIACFEPYYYISKEEIEFALRTFGMFNLIHQASVTKIDCIIKKPDAYSQSAFSRRKPIKIDGCEVSIISKEDLIVAKLIWLKETDSERQKADIRNLLQTKHDEILLRTLTDILGLTQLLESLT